MQKVASFIVRKHKSVMTLMVIIAVLCGLLSTKVNINEDMTEYLPDTSSMKQGMDIMSEEFPEMETTNSIRVMIQDLTDVQKRDVLVALEKLEYADSVDYDSTENHNKGNQTLYTVNTVYDYGSEEEKALESHIADAVNEYTYVMKNNDTSTDSIPVYIMIAALAILMIVLWIMCGSWVEPLLFLLTIGIAVIINSGTNYFLGSVSSITNMIAALLQLVLSMDYSIILMNRYRQELALNPNRTEAMSVALGHAFSSISSSSITTVVGLLALVFMSFKIGMDLGIVLAKGVLISMICVFTVLPGLILMCSKLIQKTAKKVPHIPMGGLGRFSYRFRIPVAIAFVLLFAASYILQGNTQTAFTLTSEDPIADVFPNANTIVLIYRNEDDGAVAQITDDLLENDDKVKAAISYPTTLGKPYTVTQMADALDAMSDKLELDPDLLKILYYDYYCHNDPVKLTASEFLHFLSEDVLTNQLIAGELDSGVSDQIDLMMEFADAGNLTKKKTVSELANVFGMENDMVEKLLLLYYTGHGGVNTGSMTLPVFANFVANEVAGNSEYSSMFDSNTISMMNTLLTYTDASKMTAPRAYQEIANLLGMDEESAKMLFIYYDALQEGNDPGTMTVTEFADLIQNKLAKDSYFGSYLDETTISQAAMLSTFTDKEMIQAQRTPDELSGMLGIDQTMIEQIFQLALPEDTADKTMSAVQLVDFLLSHMSGQLDDHTLGQLQMIQGIMQDALNDKAYTYGEMASMFGMDEDMMKLLYTLGDSSKDTGGQKLSVQTVVHFLLNNKDQFASAMGSNVDQLYLLQSLIDNSVAGNSYTYDALAKLLGMDSTKLRQLYLLYQTEHGSTSGWGISLDQFVTFIQQEVLSNANYAGQMDGDAAEMLSSVRVLMNAVISGKKYDAAELTDLFGGLTEELDGNTMELLTMFYGSEKLYQPEWTMSIHQMFDYLTGSILNDARFESFIDDDVRDAISENCSTIEDGIAQMKGKNYSRLILNTIYSDESEETSEFIGNLIRLFDSRLEGDYYLIGSSVMNYEMENSFDSEMLMITMITALAIFAVVALTFRSLVIPLVLVLIVQCGVYITVTTIGLQGYSIYYLALLIVQSILMGATIDYGILYTNYYLEGRKTMPVKEALIEAYNGSIHTILTSGLILILVTGIVGHLFTNPTIGQICKTISTGALSASLLILFMLPAILAVLDRWIVRKKNVE